MDALADKVVDKPPLDTDPALGAVLDRLKDQQREPEDEDRKRARYLYCAQCSQAVTQPEQAISINGGHQHLCMNPHGFEFDLGCYREALGCAISGEPTHADSWFPGFLWRYAHCADCQQHLGWYFERSDAYFYGLIRERIRE